MRFCQGIIKKRSKSFNAYGGFDFTCCTSGFESIRKNGYYFVDKSDLINDLKTFGFIFENLCIRDLRVYAEVIDGKVFHYRDKTNLECDAVIHLANGKYGLVEIKLGGQENIDKGANSLLKLASRIDEDKMGPPSFIRYAAIKPARLVL